MEVVDNHDHVGQAGADRGAVGGRHVDRDVGDVLAPGQFGGREPGQDVGGGAALDLAEQPAGAQGVDEAGVPAVTDQLPLPGFAVLFPLRAAPAGLVDAQHPHLGQRLGGDLAGLHREGGHHPTGRTGPRRQVRRGEMHPAPAVLQPLDAVDGHPVQIEQ